ncbi:biopolymer transporter ExbD [Benzoatithermus flavus]|uniref:Biopolymer transporter ExbD n=1 Tax=Benzoatithermus flavus TaxID=3108223 RepID=A0ABU8XW18_9PROT
MALSPIGNEAPGGYRPLAEINVTPLVDVMLVLLVVFMATTPLMTAEVPVQLPRIGAKAASPPRDPLVLSIDRTGRVYLDDEPVEPAALGDRLRALAATDPSATLHVRGDRTIAYGEVMRIMGLASGAGFAKVILLAEAGEAPVATTAR